MTASKVIKTVHSRIVVAVVGLLSFNLVPGSQAQPFTEAEDARPVGAAPPADAWRTTDAVIQAINRGVAHMERYEYAQAVVAFEQAHEAAPNSVEIQVNLAIAFYNRAGSDDLGRAEEMLDAVLEKDPDNVRAWYFRGITHQYNGRDDEAVRCFEQVLKRRPHDAATWYLMARSKSHLDQPCRGDLERAVQENPALVSAYYDLMRFARQDGDHEQAERYKETFLKLNESPLAEKVVMPNYNQMGPLAAVEPASSTVKRSLSSGELSAGPEKIIFRAAVSQEARDAEGDSPADGGGRYFAGMFHELAMADVNDDDRLDVVVTGVSPDARVPVRLLLGQANGTFADATRGSGLETVHDAASAAFGDYDNDGIVDLFVTVRGGDRLYRGQGNGTFKDVTEEAKIGGPGGDSGSAVFLDADHDSDLDIYVSHAGANDMEGGSAVSRLWNNNGDGTFTNIAEKAGVACPNERSVMLAPADLDGDRDTDLMVFNQSGLVRVFFNDRSGKYHEGRITKEPIVGGNRGVAQDFNGDGMIDLLVSPGPQSGGRLYLSDGTEVRKRAVQFDDCVNVLGSWQSNEVFRVVDLDLDGDLDIVILRRSGHVLLNDGWGRFVAKVGLWPDVLDDEVVGAEVVDLTNDGVADIVTLSNRGGGRIKLIPTELAPPANWIAVTPTGDRGADKRTRSPASGFGTRIELRCGLHRQVVTYTGLHGGFSQSHLPLVLGLNGATKADYLHFTWPDGVTQCENEIAANARHRIKEMERRVSSCPVLFAWNGRRLEFIGDFAGVGGLGYYIGPGEYARPQVLEHVRIGPDQLAARDGFYELRVAEPMEEVAYIDRLELLAVDHPRKFDVYPDERLAITGPPPTHKLLCPVGPIFPVKATAPDGTDCTEPLRGADRVYAYQPKLDRRFYGFCAPHTLVVDFGDRLNKLARSLQSWRKKPPSSPLLNGGNRGVLPATGTPEVYLFLNGWIEYPYSQTTYAAAQAGVQWEPMKIERQTMAGQWETIIPDAGAPGGMGRTITIDLTQWMPQGIRKLRITTNLEIYYDQLFIGADRGTDDFAITTAPLAAADLRRLGFPLEFTPDGHHPYIYTYDIIAPTSSFKVPKGNYTRYGPVEPLLTEFDDRYVILGTGDEIALRFHARDLPPLPDNWTRSFILVSHAYCKDMDLYTGAPDTVEPLPFGKMNGYPYPNDVHYPDGGGFDDLLEGLHTRLVE